MATTHAIPIYIYGAPVDFEGQLMEFYDPEIPNVTFVKYMTMMWIDTGLPTTLFTATCQSTLRSKICLLIRCLFRFPMVVVRRVAVPCSGHNRIVEASFFYRGLFTFLKFAIHAGDERAIIS